MLIEYILHRRSAGINFTALNVYIHYVSYNNCIAGAKAPENVASVRQAHSLKRPKQKPRLRTEASWSGCGAE
jgi:hypothetical protein